MDNVYPVVYRACIHVKVRDAGAARVKAVLPASRGAFPNDDARQYHYVTGNQR